MKTYTREQYGSKEFWVKFPNGMLYGPTKATPEECFLWCYLHTKRWNANFSMVETSIDLISSRVKFMRNVRENQNRKRIKSILLALQQKGWIKITNEQGPLGYGDSLIIVLTLVTDKFTEVTPEILEMTDHPEKLKVLITITHFRDPTIAFTQWADILGKCEKHAKSLIKEMEEIDGLIRVDHGAYYIAGDVRGKKQFRQKMNSYEVGTEPNAPATSEPNKKADTLTKGNWYDWKARITDKDLRILLLAERQGQEPEFVAAARRRISIISSKNPGAAKSLKDLEKQALKHIEWQESHKPKLMSTAEQEEIQKAEQEQQRVREEEHRKLMEEIDRHFEQPSTKNQDDDISDLLDDEQQPDEEDPFASLREKKSCIPA